MTHQPELRRGVAFAVLAYGAWGIIPLFWRLLDGVPPVELLAFRVVFSLAFISTFLVLTRSFGPVLSALRDPKTRLLLALSSVLIGINWGVFIASIQLHRLSDASLGYFLNPLCNVALGVIVLKERLRPLQTAAVALASVAVILLVVLGGGLPWIALVLAGTFAIYGLVRKTVVVGATVGLLVETLILSPFALVYLAWLGPAGSQAVSAGSSTFLLAAASGPVTALPLVWFSRGARALPLSTLGLTQYLAPTGQFLIAVFLFGESMPSLKWVAFGLIWLGLAMFSFDLVRHARQSSSDAGERR